MFQRKEIVKTEKENILPPEIANRAIQKNVLNIAKKAADGKSLSAREIQILEGQKNPTKRRIVESIPAAAAICKATEDVVKRAKKLGCPAFEAGNRIDVALLSKWLKENNEEMIVKGDNISLKDQKLNEEIRKLRIANDGKEKLVILKSQIIARDSLLADRFKTTLYSKLVDEAPADMTNDVATNRALLRNVADRLLSEVASWQKEMA